MGSIPGWVQLHAYTVLYIIPEKLNCLEKLNTNNTTVNWDWSIQASSF